MKTIIPTVKGARDFYPKEKGIQNWLYRQLGEISNSFGYQEYDGPFLEKIDLYAAKSGEELVKEQAFVFPDRGGDLITLRPELTPSLARMVAQVQNELIYPLRWWSFGPFWRYERPQKGRSREFFQWNIDLIGVNSPIADAELIAIAATFFKAVGLTPEKVEILVNDRNLMETQLSRFGLGGKNKTVFRWIDRRDKMRAEEWDAFGLELGLSLSQLDDLKSLFIDRELWKASPTLTAIFHILIDMGLEDYLTYNATTIRGLDYYTGMVFEARDRSAEGRAILGGGHYDNLVGDVGGQPLPGVGFAMGDVMVSVVLEKYGLLPVEDEPPADVLVTVFNEDLAAHAAETANWLRQSGLRVILYPEAAKLVKQFKFADRLRLPIVIVEGPDELNAGVVTVKDLRGGTQSSVPFDGVGDTVRQMLASG